MLIFSTHAVFASSKKIVVAIAGGTGAGKSRLREKFMKRFREVFSFARIITIKIFPIFR